MLAVFCVWSGSAKFGEEYPVRLRAMLARHLTRPARFFSISKTHAPGWEHIPADDIGNREGCWHKLQLFKPGIVPRGTTCLYFDLDVVIVGSVDYVPTSGPFCAMKDEVRPTMNSSVMTWIAGPQSDYIYHEWQRVQPSGKTRTRNWRVDGFKGDQDFIHTKVVYQQIPRVHGYKLGPPPDASVIVFYGRPKMSDLPADHPMRRAWENGGIRVR